MRAVKRSTSPVPVEVYSPKFFMKNPTPSIFDAMQMVNGVRPQLNCNICNTGDIHINGLEGPYTMVMIDGMPIVSSLASIYGLAGIPASLVEKIEVVKGPASSLYGSEAIGGLINVITKKPETAPRVSMDVFATGWGEYNADLGLSFSAGKRASALVGLNYFNYNRPFDKNHDHFTDLTLQNRFSVFNKISWKRNQDRDANIAVRYVYEDRWGGEMNWNKSFRGGDSVYGESIYTSRVELVGNYQLPVSERIIFSYSANVHEQRSAYGNTIYNAMQQVVFGQLTWQKEIKRHVLLAGAVSRYTWYDDNTPATFDYMKNMEKPDKIILPGFFIQDEYNVKPRQTILTGIRYDYDKRHGNIVTPRIAYKIGLRNKDVIRVNAGTGFRVVNVFTEDHAALTGARTVVIPHALKPEKSYNANINYVKKIFRTNHMFLMDLSVWYTHFTNRIVPDYTTNVNQIIYNNLDGFSVSRGFSANMEYGYGNALRVTAGLTLMNVTITTHDITGRSNRSSQLLSEKWTGTWTISYNIPSTAVSIDYTGNAYGPMLLPLLSSTDPRPAKSPAWSIHNVQVSSKLGEKFTVYGGVKNLFNWTPFKHAPFLIARTHDPFDKKVEFSANGQAVVNAENPYGLTFDPNYVYAPNQGIRGFLGIRYTVKK
jgi:outer membrane receptor for ferrienterochelin and colicins